jgi:hypothetical protein
MRNDKSVEQCRHEHTIYQAIPVNSTLGMWLGLRPSVMIVEVCQDCGAYRIVRKPAKIKR